MTAPASDRLVVLTGATASGKTAVALELAARSHAEIVSVDSMQVYRGLDIGTAKPSLAERARVRHHLVDVLDLAETCDAARFLELASRAVQEIHEARRLALLCGGPGLYLRAWLDGIGTAPEPDPQLRAQLEATPLPSLLAELERLDPVAFAQIDRKNPRRVIRAVEICRLSGRPLSEQRAAWRLAAASSLRPPIFALRRARADLHARVARRVEQMFAAGLVEETRRLLELGLAGNRTALQAIGYRQVVEHLQGQRGLAETQQRIVEKTRALARRQETWLRRETAVEWLEVAPDEPATAVAQRLHARLEARVVTPAGVPVS